MGNQVKRRKPVVVLGFRNILILARTKIVRLQFFQLYLNVKSYSINQFTLSWADTLRDHFVSRKEKSIRSHQYISCDVGQLSPSINSIICELSISYAHPLASFNSKQRENINFSQDLVYKAIIFLMAIIGRLRILILRQVPCELSPMVSRHQLKCLWTRDLTLSVSRPLNYSSFKFLSFVLNSWKFLHGNSKISLLIRIAVYNPYGVANRFIGTWDLSWVCFCNHSFVHRLFLMNSKAFYTGCLICLIPKKTCLEYLNYLAF